MRVEIPPGLAAGASRGPGWDDWLVALPRLAGDLLDEWELSPDGDAMHGFTALVLPVRTSAGAAAALKVAWPHDEEEHEHLALQAWQGNAAVRLLRADPRRHVMLLERLDATRDLRSVPDLEACEIIAGLYPRLHRPALPQLRSLTTYIERWTADLQALPRDAPLPRRQVEQAVALGRAFASDPASDGVLIHGDLHFENVLAAEREPWLVIDPKPMSGDPHYEVAPVLWNRWDEIVASGNVRDAVRRRFHTVVDTAGLDEFRARDWVVVREVHNAMWRIVDSGGRLDASGRDYVTTCVAIAKAVQD